MKDPKISFCKQWKDYIIYLLPLVIHTCLFSYFKKDIKDTIEYITKANNKVLA